MKKQIVTMAILLAMSGAAAAQQEKDTVRIHSDRIELQHDAKGKPFFTLYSDDNETTKKVNTDKKSAENFGNGGTPFLIFNLNEFGERKISKVYVTSK